MLRQNRYNLTNSRCNINLKVKRSIYDDYFFLSYQFFDELCVWCCHVFALGSLASDDISPLPPPLHQCLEMVAKTWGKCIMRWHLWDFWIILRLKSMQFSRTFYLCIGDITMHWAGWTASRQIFEVVCQDLARRLLSLGKLSITGKRIIF